jgi:hypothetical protein
MKASLLQISLSIYLCILLHVNSQEATTTQVINSVVYPQLNGILNFDAFTPAIQIQTNAGNFNTTKQFTLWGWFRQFNYYTFQFPSNIITVQNVQNLSSQEILIQPYPNPNFPNCPKSLSELDAFPELKDVPEIKNNPNCFPLEITNDNIQNINEGSVSITNDEILFINYLLSGYNAEDINNSTYDLQFYLKNKDFDPNGGESMQLFSISNLPFVQNLWTFWAVAANYETGEIILYMRVFGPGGYERLQPESINYPNFEMNQGSLLLIGATNSNRYFKTLTGYIGEVAYIQMSPFFLKNVQHLWISEMLVEDTLYDGVNGELLFDTYEKNGIIKSYGFNSENVTIEGNYTPIYTINNELLGARFQSGSSFTFPNFKYRGSPFVSSHPFVFNFSYQEALPNEFILLEKGSPGQTGYLVFKLIKEPSGKRKLVIEAVSANKTFKWTSAPTFEPNTSYNLMAGIVVSANKTVHALMKVGDGDLYLSDGMVNFEGYDFEYNNIRGLNNSESYSGNFTFNRLNILDNFSGGVLMNLEQNNNRLQSFSGNCLTRTDYFDRSFGCLICKKGFVNIPKDRTCQKYCPPGFRNNGVGVCVACLYSNCSDIGQITWSVKVENEQENIYRLIPSRPLYPPNLNIEKLLTLGIKDLEINKDYTYTLNPGPNNEHVDVKFDFKKNIYNESVNVKFASTDEQKVFDEYGNQISGSEFDFKLKNSCQLSSSRQSQIKNLALAALILTLSAIFLALCILCCCTKKLQGDDIIEKRTPTPRNELSNSIWKFLLHNWMKLQMVAFLIFINTPFPCCLRIFLEWLYRYAVGWAHGFSPVWDSAHQGDSVYQNGILNNSPPEYLNRLPNEKSSLIKAYLLHNMGVIFIFHLVILVVYIIFRIVDCMLGTNENMFYKCFIIIHLNLMILGYMLFHMMAFVFSFLNFVHASFSTTYFVISFIVAVLYILGKFHFIFEKIF